MVIENITIKAYLDLCKTILTQIISVRHDNMMYLYTEVIRMKIEIKLISMLIISSFVIGCVGNTSTPDAQGNSKNITMQELESAVEILQTKCDPSLTSDGCTLFRDNQLKLFESNVDNKYLVSEGYITDVSDGVVHLVTPSKYTYRASIPPVERENAGTMVNLYDISSKERQNLRKGSVVSFIGQISFSRTHTSQLNLAYNGDTRGQMYFFASDSSSQLTLYNGEINDSGKLHLENNGNTNSNPITYNVDENGNKLVDGETRYYIDTSPSGMGIVYINNKVSPTTGILPPGSYQFNLEIGNNNYAFPVGNLNGITEIKIIVPVAGGKIIYTQCDKNGLCTNSQKTE